MFAVVVEDHSAEMLEMIIKKYINPRSIVYSDLWRGYMNLFKLGYKHATVNHSKEFKSDNSVCTNIIEGIWKGVKICIPPRNRMKDEMDDYVMEFIWCRQNKDRFCDAFIEALFETKYE